MKCFCWMLLAAGLVVPALVVPALGQVGGTVGTMGNGGGSTHFGGGQPADAAKYYLQSIDPSVGLTDEQKQTITTIFDERAKEIADNSVQNNEQYQAALKAYQDAQKSKDQAAMDKAGQQMTQIYTAMSAATPQIIDKYKARLDKVLTKEQKAKLDDANLTKLIKMFTDPAVLTDNQLKALKAAYVGDNAAARYAALTEAIDNVLTPQQKAAIKKGHAMTNLRFRFYAIELTPDQIKDAEAACDQIVKDTNLTKQEIDDKLAEKVTALLTPEQKKTFDAAPKPTGHGWMIGPDGKLKPITGG